MFIENADRTYSKEISKFDYNLVCYSNKELFVIHEIFESIKGIFVPSYDTPKGELIYEQYMIEYYKVKHGYVYIYFPNKDVHLRAKLHKVTEKFIEAENGEILVSIFEDYMIVKNSNSVT